MPQLSAGMLQQWNDSPVDSPSCVQAFETQYDVSLSTDSLLTQFVIRLCF